MDWEIIAVYFKSYEIRKYPVYMHNVGGLVSNPVVHKLNTGLEGIHQIHGASAFLAEICRLQ
jgi:hypothetical protein